MIDAEILCGMCNVVQTKNSKVAEKYHHGKPAAITGARKADRPCHERCSSQMRSSHHVRGGCGVV